MKKRSHLPGEQVAGKEIVEWLGERSLMGEAGSNRLLGSRHGRGNQCTAKSIDPPSFVWLGRHFFNASDVPLPDTIFLRIAQLLYRSTNDVNAIAWIDKANARSLQQWPIAL
jgi:hypothetical protein